MAAGNHILKTFSLATMLRMARLLLSLVLTCLLARHLGGAGFGELAVAMALVSILLSVGELGFSRYTVREIMKDGSDAGDVLGTTITARLIVSALLFIGLIAWIGVSSPHASLLYIVYGTQLLTNPATEVLAWLEANGRVSKAVIAQFIGFLASAVFIAFGIWKNEPLWFFALTYALEGWIFIALSACAFWRHGGRIHLRAFQFSRAWALFSRSWPELASQAALILLFRLDTMMIEWLRGPEEAGVYGAAVRVSEMAYFVPGILATLFLPRLMEARQTQSSSYDKRVIDYFSASVMLAFAVAAGLLILSPLLPFAFGHAFERSSEMLRIHAWAFIPYAIGIARTQILTVEDKLAANLPSVIVSVFVNAWLNTEWIPAHGGVGAAWATLVSYTLAWIIWTYFSPDLRAHVSSLMTRAFIGLPRFTLVRARSLFTPTENREARTAN
ncbi:flippase [Prosthecobacter sp.]|jgi:O-antigen/teichoic acid export membrane protein|uniref:flippase n=1 Tax=Prosthecobacter sp. TaxID=1965333 RepID=UPI0037842B4A